MVHFFFCPDGYDENEILDLMYDLDADNYNLVKASKKMRKAKLNEGFTFTNPAIKEAVVVIGPTSSGKQFQKLRCSRKGAYDTRRGGTT